MSGVWKQSHGRASEAPPNERGGNRYVRPTAPASHLDSTQIGGYRSQDICIEIGAIELFRCRFLMQHETMIYGFTRVSTSAQDKSGQVKQLKAAGCERIFREKIIGTTADRPQLTKPKEALAPGRYGDHSGR